MAIILNNFIDNFTKEVIASKNLRWYAFGLVLVHFLTALFWQQQDAVTILSEASQRICWPVFPECNTTLKLSYIVSSTLLLGYVGLCFAAVFYYFKNWRLFWYLLLILEAYKLFIQFIDYRFMGNYHFMPHILTFTFLFFGNRKTWARIWLVTFYMGAALLKVNQEWLSGASLAWKIPFGNVKLLPFLAMAALLIEINAPIFLLIEKKWTRYIGLLALLSFHLVSFYWVGFFYPLVMLSLLVIFIPAADERVQTEYNSARKGNAVLVAIWILFFVNQVYRVYDYRNTATDAYKRLASLNMFDALTNCVGFYLVKEGSVTVHVPFPNQNLAVRVRCDKIIFDNYLKKICQDKTKTVSAYLSVRLQHDSSWENNFFEEDACAKNL